LKASTRKTRMRSREKKRARAAPGSRKKKKRKEKNIRKTVTGYGAEAGKRTGNGGEERTPLGGRGKGPSRA